MIPPPSTAANANTAQATIDDEHDGATLFSDTNLSPTNNSNGSRKHLCCPPPLNFGSSTTIPSCTCGESLCGYDCHFLQQELKEFEAAAARGTRQLNTRQRHDSTGSTSSSENQQQYLEYNDDDEVIADLKRRFRRHFAGAAASTGFDDTCVEDILADADVSPPARMSLRRTKSCGVHRAEFDQEQLQLRHNAYRLRIGYHDEALRERCEQNTHALLQRAVSDDSDATSILARKALRYRRILERMEGVDVMDSSLDVSECLGMHWQRVGSPT